MLLNDNNNITIDPILGLKFSWDETDEMIMEDHIIINSIIRVEPTAKIVSNMDFAKANSEFIKKWNTEVKPDEKVFVLNTIDSIYAIPKEMNGSFNLVFNEKELDFVNEDFRSFCLENDIYEGIFSDEVISNIFSDFITNFAISTVKRGYSNIVFGGLSVVTEDNNDSYYCVNLDIDNNNEYSFTVHSNRHDKYYEFGHKSKMNTITISDFV